MSKGTLYVFTGPSGTGKGTILKEVLAADERIQLSVSATTRDPRPGEENGVHYWFLKKDELIILVSQSGETADTIEALNIAKKCGNDTLGIINEKGSTIAREAKMVLYTEAGKEIAVATTKA